jgi:gas vesicle protein
MKQSGSFISGLLTGAVIGGVIALLFAPKSGKETREQLKLKFDEIEKEFESLHGKVNQKSHKQKDELADKVAELKREIENLSKSI